MARRDEIEPRFGWLPTIGAAAGILLLLGGLAVAALDAGDSEPRADAIRSYLADDAQRRRADLAPDAHVERCEDTQSRLPALDPVAVYRCELGDGTSACFAVDGTEVVAAGRQLETTRGCEP